MNPTDNLTPDQLLAENADLRARLAEAEETLRAIREGEVDAVVVSGSKGDRVFALTESESLPRLMVETMNEAGLAVAPDGLVVFSNGRLAVMLGGPKYRLLGHNLAEFVAPADADRFRQLLQTAATGNADARLDFVAMSGALVPMHVWASYLDRADGPLICLVATDLSRVEADRALIAQLKEQQEQLRAARISALNLMQDAVAARQQAEQVATALHASEQRLALAASGTRLGMFDWNIATGECLGTEQLFQLIGLRTTTTLSQPYQYRQWAERVHPEDLPRVEAAIGFAIVGRECPVRRGFAPLSCDQTPPDGALFPDGAKPLLRNDTEQGHSRPTNDRPDTLDLEYRVVWPDGSVHWLVERGVFQYDVQDQPQHLLGIVMDITERKLAEEALREQERLHKSVTDNATLALFIMDDRQHCVFMNPAAEELTGYRLEETQGRPLHDVVHHTRPDGRPYPLSECAIDRAFPTNDRENGEEVFVHKDGHFYTVAFTASPLRDASGRPVGTIIEVQDITERKRAEEKLRQLNRTLEALTNSDRALIHSADEASYLREVCRIIVVDCGHVLVWVGYADQDEAKTVRPVASAGFAAGYLDTLQITWADTERGRGPTGTAIRTGQVCQCRNIQTDPQFAPWRAEAIQRGFGSSAAFPLLADGKAFGALTIYAKEPDGFDEEEVQLLSELAGDFAYGITTLRLRQAHAEAEKALRQSEAQFRLLFEANPNPMWVFDEETLRFLAVNDAAVRHYGYSQEEFRALTILDIRPPEERDHVQAIVSKQIGVHNAHVGIFRHCKKDGTVIDVEIVASSIPFAGRPGRLVLATDVTDRVRAEQALREAHEQLERRVLERTADLQRELAERRRLENAIQKVTEAEQRRLGTALHDGVGQYLAALKMLTGALEKQLTERRATEAADVRKISGYVTETFELTRQLARGLCAADVEREGLVAALEHLASNITNLFKVACQCRCRQPLPVTDHEAARQLYRIAHEAATNAAKHSGGKRITIGLRATGGHLTLTVADNGHGLRSAPSPSPGMGLTIMRYRAQSIGATLDISQRPRGGTQVICVLRLPAAPLLPGTKP